MAFEKIVPEWNATGVEPPESLKTSGFKPGDKPPAAYFNWFMHGTGEAVKELQEKAANAADVSAHTTNKNNPHGVTPGQIGAVTTSQFSEHTNNKENPHGVTPDQIGAAAKKHTHNAADITGLPDTKSARFVVGTSANGWTTADCDYLCDGTADDVEIKAAIAALRSTGGEVILLDGKYTLASTITISVNNTTLQGNGAKLERAFAGTSGNTGMIVVNASNCTIRGIVIDGKKATYSDSGYNYGIYVKGNNNTIENCYTENNGHCGIIVASGSGHIVIGNHSVSNGTYGVYLSSDHCTAIGNTCSDNTRGITTWGDGLVISCNTCRGNSETNIHLYSSNYCIVTSNNCIVESGDSVVPSNAIRIQDSYSTNNIVIYNQVGTGSVQNNGVNNTFSTTIPIYYGTEAERDAHNAHEGDIWFVIE